MAPAKRFAALARVSSREQEREGFSLDVQEDALHRYAQSQSGEIVRFEKIAETASKNDERKVFKELIAYCKANKHKLDGLLFFKVDRAARNLFDYVELERLENEHGVKVIYVSQPTENSPAGRMMRRTLANMAAFYTEQQSVDVRQGQARRVASGLFANRAVYGYANVRHDGRSLVEVHPRHGAKVTMLFDLFARGGHTIDSLQGALYKQGILYSDTQPEFPRSKLHTILRDRSYLGEVSYHANWYPGVHPPLVDRPTFSRVQQLLGEDLYRSHELVFAGELIACGHCQHPITGECKTKQTKQGPKDYTYYRCAKYNREGHPRVRLAEEKVEAQVLATFDSLRIKDEAMRSWFGEVLRARAQENCRANQQQSGELERQLTVLKSQQDRLLNMRLNDEIDEARFGAKNTELRDRMAAVTQQVGSSASNRQEDGENAIKAFELSQTLTDKWVRSDYLTKRQLLETVCLNFTLDGVTLVPTMRKPFSVLAEGLSVPWNRGDRI